MIRFRLLGHLIGADLKLFFYSRTSMFWTFAFPILMLVMLMSLFGHNSRIGPVTLALADQDKSLASLGYLDELRAGIKRQDAIVFLIENGPDAEADIELTVPAGFATRIAARHSTTIQLKSSLQSGQTLDAVYSLLHSLSEGYNLAGLTTAPRVIFPERPDTSGIAADYGLYLVTGLSGLIVLSTALMGFAVPLVSARESGLFRMYRIFPMPTGLLVVAWWVSRLAITLIATAVMVGFAFAVYGIHLPDDPGGIACAAAILVLGCAAFLSLGMLVAAVSANVAMASLFANLLYFPLLFSGNLMIPLGGLPPWARRVLDCLPMNAMVGSMRHFVTDSFVWPSVGYAVALLMLMMVVCLALSARTFGWMPRGV